MLLGVCWKKVAEMAHILFTFNESWQGGHLILAISSLRNVEETIVLRALMKYLLTIGCMKFPQ
jgi:hypothetical protein